MTQINKYLLEWTPKAYVDFDGTCMKEVLTQGYSITKVHTAYPNILWSRPENQV